MKEIGSEFWKTSKKHIKDNETIYLSGRTALDTITKDAIKSYGITSVLLPSYCCHTMIEPFSSNDINVRFYDVYIKDNVLVADIPAPKKNELLYVMKYFGDTDLQYEGEGKSLFGWTATVEDLTHSCFSFENYEKSSKADYWFTSYRKWFAAVGIAVAGKCDGKLLEPKNGINREYVQLRSKAFFLKQRFMTGECVDKQEFLNIFGEAENLLGDDYQDYGAAYEDIYDLFQFMDKIEKVRDIRRNNASVLIDGLKSIEGVGVFVDFKDSKKCPLFVPIAVEDDRRDSLKKYLISEKIYCPVHWPLPEQRGYITKRAEKIYRDELSLVCDQRYAVNDMERIVNAIHKFFMA